MPTTTKISDDMERIIRQVQKEHNLEYFKDAHELLIKLGLETLKGNSNIQRIEIREPIIDSENQIPPCPYASQIIKQTKNGLEYYSYCDNPMKKNLPKDRLLPIQACQNCYKREKSIETELKNVMKELRKYWAIWHCFVFDHPKYNDGDVHAPQDFFYLPCFQDFNFENEYCEQDDCPLHLHKEWRKLIASNLDKIF